MLKSNMKIALYRYGEAKKLKALAIGVTRQVPRGVKKEERAALGYFDVWYPNVSPSADLVHAYQEGDIDFEAFAKKYRAEMKSSEARHEISFLAAVAQRTPVAFGCFCEDEKCCHRSLLRELVEEACGELPTREGDSEERREGASPPCAMPEIEAD